MAVGPLFYFSGCFTRVFLKGIKPKEFGVPAITSFLPQDLMHTWMHVHPLQCINTYVMDIRMDGMPHARLFTSKEPELVQAQTMLSLHVPTPYTLWGKPECTTNTEGIGVRRTKSMEKLDDRRQSLTTLSISVYCSSDDENIFTDDTSSISGMRKARSSSAISSNSASSFPKPYEVDDDNGTLELLEDPLYQHIHTTEFGFDSSSTPVNDRSSNSPLQLARKRTTRLLNELWCQQSKIVKSGLLGTLSKEEQKLQETMFEVIVTESSYVRSLDVLVNHFMDDPGMTPGLPEGMCVLNRHQHHVLFSNIREVREVAKKFLGALESRLKESSIIRNICDIIVDFASNHFNCYVIYCCNQVFQTRKLVECTNSSILFQDYVRRLESHDCCQRLQLHSFLLLPMQRITRLPLLILNILNHVPVQHKDRMIVEEALYKIQSLVTECNETAKTMERTEQLHTIHNQLDFGKIKLFPLVSASRHLVRNGALCRLSVDCYLYGRHKISYHQLFVFMFNDYIIVVKTKRSSTKGKEMYRIIDHASRKFVHVVPIQYHSGLSYPKRQSVDYTTVANWAVSTAMVQFAFLVSILENATGSTEHYVFTANSDSERTRWVEAINPPESNKSEETIYEAWDCPQVQAIYDYDARQPDELSLNRGDAIKVFRKLSDGWYEGERMRDLQWGWFPSNFTVEIDNEHTRARNLRERYCLISEQFNIEELNKIINQDK